MKKFYIQPQTLEALYMLQSNLLIPGSGEGPEPAPLRKFEGDVQGIKYLAI